MLRTWYRSSSGLSTNLVVTDESMCPSHTTLFHRPRRCTALTCSATAAPSLSRLSTVALGNLCATAMLRAPPPLPYSSKLKRPFWWAAGLRSSSCLTVCHQAAFRLCSAANPPPPTDAATWLPPAPPYSRVPTFTRSAKRTRWPPSTSLSEVSKRSFQGTTAGREEKRQRGSSRKRRKSSALMEGSTPQWRREYTDTPRVASPSRGAPEDDDPESNAADSPPSASSWSSHWIRTSTSLDPAGEVRSRRTRALTCPAAAMHLAKKSSSGLPYVPWPASSS
mmetsp:Transcript_47110/g.93294  ORF Transcript_47110/g.93294 Transcript_47110/m.93294 type:complete len:279 (-) Transcript_47110:929-1765(-)